MADLVVVLAPSGASDRIREVLTDWSAAGIVDDFVWVESRSVTALSADGLFVERGALRGAPLQSAFTGRALSRIRLVVLLPLADGLEARVASAVEQQVAQTLESSGSAAGVTRIRLAVVRAGDATTTEDLARSGWHNVVVAPEQSTAPGRGRMLIARNSDDRALAAHAASVLAGLGGLWSGIEGGPLDGEAIAPGEVVRLARSYYRRLDSGSAERALRREVTSTVHGLPLPVGSGPAVLAVEDVALATSTMAKALWARHPDVLRGPREVVRTVEPQPIGAMAAIRLFFGFLWASMRSAPAQWYRRTVNRVSSALASRVHRAVFGADPAAYSVVVNGVSADGRPADWEALGHAAEAIDTVLAGDGEDRTHLAPTDLSALWADYASGALTLADAGDRVGTLPPVTIGTQRAVISDPAQIVPSRSARFTASSASLGLAELDGYDVLGITEQHRMLSQAERNDVSLGLDAGRTLDRLREWTATQRSSFATQVAEPLGGAVTRTAREVGELLEVLRTGGSTDIDDGAIREQQRFARALRIMTIGMLVALVVLGVLRWTSVLTWKPVAIAAAVVVVAWLVVGIVTFARNQRELFRILNARDAAASQAEAARRNLRQAVRDLKRTSDAYGQFLAWSAVLGGVLDAPLGPETTAGVSSTRVGGPLPLGVQLGEVRVDDAVIASAALTIRGHVFRLGWLDGPWTAALESAPDLLGAEGQRLRADPRALLKETSTKPGSALARFADSITSVGVSGAVADRMWDDTRARLRETFPDVVRSVLGRVDVGSVPADLNDFLGGIGDGAAPSGVFDSSLLTAAAQSSDASAVTTSWSSRVVDGLSVVAAQTELSTGIPKYEFTAWASTAERAPLFGGDDGPRF